MRYRFAIAAVAVLGLAVPALADNYPRQPGVDAIHYSFRLTLSDDTDEVVGESTAELRFTNPREKSPHDPGRPAVKG